MSCSNSTCQAILGPNEGVYIMMYNLGLQEESFLFSYMHGITLAASLSLILVGLIGVLVI
jgi:hypothetical protein